MAERKPIISFRNFSFQYRAQKRHKTSQNKEQCRADTDSDNGLDAAVVIFHILSPLLFRGCGVSCKASLVYDTNISLQYAVLALLAAMYGPVVGGLIVSIRHPLEPCNGQSARFAEKRLLSCIWGRMPSRPVQQKRAPAPAGADAL